MTAQTASTTPALSIEHVAVHFGGLVAISDLNFDVGEGELVSLIGPNGAGKTTAFNVVTGFLKPTKGRVVFRGTPLIVQIVFWFFALPQVWPGWAPWNGQMSPFTTGVFALAINEGAYMTEIMRAGIQSVDTGQMEAAKSLGMTYPKAMRRIILPQALRVVIPPTGNEFIALLKNSSLVSVISVSELFLVAKLQYSSSLLYFEWLIIASVWYLALTTVGSIIQAWIEGRYGAGSYGAGAGMPRRWLALGARD